MPAPLPRLNRKFYMQDPVTVAKQLLGQQLVHVVNGQRIAGLIVETEAYLGEIDQAAHSFKGRRTRRTETMFAIGGTSYVYLNYGIHHLFNIVVAEIDVPQAVLIRAIEPTEGIELMQLQRPKAKQPTDLASGPGKLGAAFCLDLSHNGLDLTTHKTLYVEQLRSRCLPKSHIVESARIGVDYAEQWAKAPLRFTIKGNPHVSVKPSDENSA